jgi:hypothetical protein
VLHRQPQLKIGRMEIELFFTAGQYLLILAKSSVYAICCKRHCSTLRLFEISNVFFFVGNYQTVFVFGEIPRSVTCSFKTSAMRLLYKKFLAADSTNATVHGERFACLRDPHKRFA